MLEIKKKINYKIFNFCKINNKINLINFKNKIYFFTLKNLDLKSIYQTECCVYNLLINNNVFRILT